MVTVFMKWLETSPKDYDRGIHLLTLGRIQHIKEEIANNYVREGTRVLEIGCGTGRVLAALLGAGHDIVGVDICPDMLSIAEQKLASYLDDGRLRLLWNSLPYPLHA